MIEGTVDFASLLDRSLPSAGVGFWCLSDARAWVHGETTGEVRKYNPDLGQMRGSFGFRYFSVLRLIQLNQPRGPEGEYLISNTPDKHNEA